MGNAEQPSGIDYNTRVFEDTNGIFRTTDSKDRQYNDQKKKDKRTNNDLQAIHRKLKIEQHEPHWKSGVNSGASEGLAVSVPPSRDTHRFTVTENLIGHQYT